MPKAAKTGKSKPDLYMDLIREFPLRPIRCDEDHDRAIAMIDALSDLEQLEPEQSDYLLVLARLIEDYEAEREPAAKASPLEILRELIEANQLSQAKLAAEIGMAESTISDILTGRRRISRKAMYAFAKRFQVDASLFV